MPRAPRGQLVTASSGSVGVCTVDVKPHGCPYESTKVIGDTREQGNGSTGAGTREQEGYTDYRLHEDAASGASSSSPWANYHRREAQDLAIVNKTGMAVIPKAHMSRKPRYLGLTGSQLDKIKWQGEELVPVRKDFWSYAVHADVASRNKDQCERIRLEHAIVIVEGNWWDVPKPIAGFHEVPFPDWVVRRMMRKGFTKPTGIQAQAWPIVLQGNDLVGIAETGSGKTLAYVLPMLIHIEAQSEQLPGEGPMGLVLVPNRELCDQVERQVNEFSQDAGIVCLSVFGGVGWESHESHEAALQRRCDVLVATPGHLISLLQRKKTNLCRATFVVLDEADELLSEGFEHQVRDIMSQVRPDRQVLLFSATWEDNSLMQLAREACSCHPLHINVGSTNLAACKDIVQIFVRVGEDNGVLPGYRGMSKAEYLTGALQVILNEGDSSGKVLVFSNSREKVPEILRELRAAGIPCEGFTSDYEQAARQAILKRFRDLDNDLPVLVCTQLLGRGHDFPNLGHVFNFDMPKSLSEYVHRIGRTSRGGEKGFSLTLLEEMDLVAARDIRECMQETQQKVPAWLANAASYNSYRKYRQMCIDARYETSVVLRPVQR